jgi:Tat protein secretion system quality control protein TatD with DNase activity
MHAKDSYEIALNICRTILDADHRIYLHSFLGTWQHMRKWIDAFPLTIFGYCPILARTRLSWQDGMSVRPTATAFQRVDLGRVVLETDSPHQTMGNGPPSPHMIYPLAQDLAKLTATPLNAVADRTSRNSFEFFHEK